MICPLCTEHLTWNDRHDCAETGLEHHVSCIALCVPCQIAYTEDTNVDAARDAL